MPRLWLMFAVLSAGILPAIEALPSDLNPEKWCMAMESFSNQKRNVSQRLLFPGACARSRWQFTNSTLV